MGSVNHIRRKAVKLQAQLAERDQQIQQQQAQLAERDQQIQQQHAQLAESDQQMQQQQQAQLDKKGQQFKKLEEVTAALKRTNKNQMKLIFKKDSEIKHFGSNSPKRASVTFENSSSYKERGSNTTAKVERKGLSEVSADIATLLNLPEDLTVGMAIDDGGCFFDALAQSLNVIQQTEQHTEKSLRLACHDYYIAHKEQMDEWIKNDGIDKGDEYSFIQYTQAELDEHFNQRAPIWGRPHIEGRILCRQLNISVIRIVEIIRDPETKREIVNHFLATEAGTKQLAENELTGYAVDIPILVVSQGDLHFVPVLSKNQNSQNFSEDTLQQAAMSFINMKDDLEFESNADIKEFLHVGTEPNMERQLAPLNMATQSAFFSQAENEPQQIVEALNPVEPQM